MTDINNTSKTDAAATQSTTDNSSNSDESTTNQYGTITETPDQIEAAHHQEYFQPPFLVRTKTHEEKQTMRDRLKEQEEQRKNKHHKGPYELLGRVYNKFTTSMMLENKSATARDHLANERTFLAWLRTSLSLTTVGVAITQLYHLTPAGESNAVTHAQAGKAIGATFVIFSILFLYFANARYFHTQQSMTKGQFPASRGAVLFGSTCIGAVLIAMFIIIVIDLK